MSKGNTVMNQSISACLPDLEALVKDKAMRIATANPTERATLINEMQALEHVIQQHAGPKQLPLGSEFENSDTDDASDGSDDDRWTVRHVTPEIRAIANKIAKKEKVKVGDIVTEGIILRANGLMVKNDGNIEDGDVCFTPTPSTKKYPPRRHLKSFSKWAQVVIKCIEDSDEPYTRGCTEKQAMDALKAAWRQDQNLSRVSHKVYDTFVEEIWKPTRHELNKDSIIKISSKASRVRKYLVLNPEVELLKD